MSDEQNSPPANYTTRDLLARIEGKIDVVASKQQYVEVEMALLKARVEETEKDIAAQHSDSGHWRDELRTRIDHIDAAAKQVQARQKATAYVVGIIVTASTILTPIVLRLFS